MLLVGDIKGWGNMPVPFGEGVLSLDPLYDGVDELGATT